MDNHPWACALQYHFYVVRFLEQRWFEGEISKNLPPPYRVTVKWRLTNSPFQAQLSLCLSSCSRPVATLDCHFVNLSSVVTLGSLYMLWALPGILSPPTCPKSSLSVPSDPRFLTISSMRPSMFTIFLLRKKELSLLCDMMPMSGYPWLVCFTLEPEWFHLVWWVWVSFFSFAT